MIRMGWTEELNRYLVAKGVAVSCTPEAPAEIKYIKPQREVILETEPTGNERLASGGDDFRANVITDGTSTYVEILDLDGDVIGRGEARRRKGETRNEDLGIYLATARAFQDAARYYARAAEVLLEG